MQFPYLSARPRALRTLSALAVCAAVAALPATASAGSVSDFGDGPAFDGASGEANNLTIAASPASITFTDSNNVITVESGSNCSGGGTNTVTCPPTDASGFASWSANGGDGNDVLAASGPLGGTLFGDAGNDLLVGSNENAPVGALNGTSVISGTEYLDGGVGTDTIQARGGDDFASGGSESGPGDDNGDVIDLGAGDDDALFARGDGQGDIYQGGPGVDGVGAQGTSGGPGVPSDSFSANLATGAFGLAGATSNTATFAGFEDYFGGAYGNQVIGTAGSNAIFGGDGADAVSASLGADQVSLFGGDDAADTRDGFADRVRCGAGTDTVTADQLDELIDCERVAVTKTRPAGADVVAPKCGITKVKSTYSRTSFAKGVSLRLTCSEAATVTVQEYVTFKSSRRLATASAVGDLVLAEKTLKPGALKQTIKLKPNKRLAKRLPKKFTAKIRISAQDEFGNRSTVTKKTKVTNKKAKKKKSKSKKKKRAKKK